MAGLREVCYRGKADASRPDGRRIAGAARMTSCKQAVFPLCRLVLALVMGAGPAQAVETVVTARACPGWSWRGKLPAVVSRTCPRVLLRTVIKPGATIWQFPRRIGAARGLFGCAGRYAHDHPVLCPCPLAYRPWWCALYGHPVTVPVKFGKRWQVPAALPGRPSPHRYRDALPQLARARGEAGDVPASHPPRHLDR